MPRIEEVKKPTWQELQDLIMVSLFNSTPAESEQLNREIKILLEQERRNVCEIDKRNDD